MIRIIYSEIYLGLSRNFGSTVTLNQFATYLGFPYDNHISNINGAGWVPQRRMVI